MSKRESSLVALLVAHYCRKIDATLLLDKPAQFKFVSTTFKVSGADVKVRFSATLRELVVCELMRMYKVAVTLVITNADGEELDEGKEYMRYDFSRLPKKVEVTQ